MKNLNPYWHLLTMTLQHVLDFIFSYIVCLLWTCSQTLCHPYVFLSEHFLVCRDMWSIVFVLDVVVGRGLFPRVLCTGSPQTRVLLNWNFSAARGQLQRNELVVIWVVSGFWIHTGWMRFVAYSFIYHVAVV